MERSLLDAAFSLSSGAKPEAPAHRSVPFPSARSLLWTPGSLESGAPDSVGAQGGYEFFLTQSVLRAMNAHVGHSGREARFGFLLGELYRCPKSEVEYAVVDKTVPSEEAFSEDAPGTYLQRAWTGAGPVVSRHPGVLVGWYHSHYLLGLFESEADAEANQRFFGEPWQCAILIVPDEERPIGGLYRSLASAGERGEAATFYELLDSASDQDPPLSALTWTNYEPDRATRPEPARQIQEASSAPPSTRPPAASQRPGEPARQSGVGLVLTDDSEDRIFPRMKSQNLQLAGLVLLLIAAIALAVTSVRTALRGPAPQPTISTPVPGTGPSGPFFELATGLNQAIESYGERGSDFDLGRIGCQLLTTGYSAADDAFIAMTSEYSRLEATGSREQGIYERLVGEMNTVNRHFDGSGCPRPN